MLKKLAIFIIFFSCLEAKASDRAKHPFGIYMSTSSAYSGYYIANLAYTINDHWRVHVGEAIETRVHPVQFNSPEAGALYFFSWSNFSPYVGGTFQSTSILGVIGEVGVDWITGFGFNAGVGARIPLLGPQNMGANIYIGWYF